MWKWLFQREINFQKRKMTKTSPEVTKIKIFGEGYFCQKKLRKKCVNRDKSA